MSIYSRICYTFFVWWYLSIFKHFELRWFWWCATYIYMTGNCGGHFPPSECKWDRVFVNIKEQQQQQRKNRFLICKIIILNVLNVKYEKSTWEFPSNIDNVIWFTKFAVTTSTNQQYEMIRNSIRNQISIADRHMCMFCLQFGHTL